MREQEITFSVQRIHKRHSWPSMAIHGVRGWRRISYQALKRTCGADLVQYAG
jgi:hypothetical protein